MVAGLVILLRSTGVLQIWEWHIYDLYMRWRPLENRDRRIAIVGIDEKDLHQLQDPIITDKNLAMLLNKIKAQKPRAIGLDIYRDLPIEPGHKALVEVFATTPNLVGIQKVAGEKGIETVSPPPVLQAKGQVGANDLIFDGDNRVRRGLISLDDSQGSTIYSFSLHLALHYLEKEGITPQGTPEQWQLGKAVFKPFEANDGGYVRTDAGGYQILINYRGGNRHFETVSLTDILQNRVAPDWGRDRIILIGKVGESFKDLFFTTYSSDLVGLPVPVPGVEIQANLTSQIISAALDGRPLMRTWSDPGEWLWIIFWSAMGASFSWNLRHIDGIKFVSWRKWLGFTGLVGSNLGITYGAFLGGWWLPVVPGLLALGGSAFAITAYVAGTAISIRKTFGRYLTDQVVAQLLESPSGLKLGGERRKITLLTSDLRGFTAIAERLPPEEVIQVINLYLGQMAEVITRYQGTIDEFMGDGILVLFGAPTAKADDPERAIACALAMQLAMESVNGRIAEWGFAPLEMGIGIHTGEVVVGNIGSEKRAKYGVVGANVNLTYRIESYTIGGQILISQATQQELPDSVMIDETKQVQPKGMPAPIQVYSVVGIQGKYDLCLPIQEEIFSVLPEAILLQYAVLEGKDIGKLLFNGQMVQLSPRGAMISPLATEEPLFIPSPLSNLKMNFLDCKLWQGVSEDIYGKVLDKKDLPAGCFYVSFTAKPAHLAEFLNSLYHSLQKNC